MDGWISVRGWRRFQHYDPAKRTPPWVKNYTELMSDDAYRELSYHQRGVLHSIWMEYARARSQLPDSTLILSRRLGQRITRATLDALNHGGFITTVASKTLAEGYQAASTTRVGVETEEETETKEETLGGVKAILSEPKADRNHQPENHDRRYRKSDNTASYTGCRLVRGTHGYSNVRDILGIDPPPFDWPHPKPTRAQILTALNQQALEPAKETAT